MTPLQAIRTCLAKSFQFSGRASRAEYWWFLPIGLALPVAALWLSAATQPNQPVWVHTACAFLGGLPLMAVTRRRLADTGESPHQFETPFAALIGFLACLWAAYSLNKWAFDAWSSGADGPSGFGVMIIWLLGLAAIIPIIIKNFLVGLIYGSALFSQMAAPTLPVSSPKSEVRK
jgi:uncharacterized membrane protein YhaH (DUF805 family)